MNGSSEAEMLTHDLLIHRLYLFCQYVCGLHYSHLYCCSYRDSGEVQAVRKERDPLNLLTAYALKGNLVTEDEFKVKEKSST